MNLSINEKTTTEREISPAGNLRGTVIEQHHQILKWHEKRLAVLQAKMIEQETQIRALAEELVALKADDKSEEN